MCKAWNCSVDDKRFEDITGAQWSWYAQMTYEEDKDKYEYNLDLVEYLASFWNSEAVRKVRDSRETRGDERFATDEEFERQILEGDFKLEESDELIKAIKDRYKNTNLDDSNRNRSRDARSTRMPKDMSKLFKMTGDEIE